MPLPREVVVSARAPSVVDLAFARRGTITVLALDPHAEALLEGIRVRLVASTGEEVAHALTGPDGTCRFRDVRVGSYTVCLDPPAGFRAITQDRPVTLGTSQALELEFELERAGLVRGRVVDEDTGEPLVGVMVRLYNADGSFVREALTLANGEYEFANLPEDRYEVEVEG
jgi:uncharacterized surface anchored protein